MSVTSASSLNALDIRAPFVENKPEGKNNRIFEQEAQKTIGEKIKGLFAIVCAQTKSMMPGDDNKQDLGSLWMQASSVIAQVMNTNKVEENTNIQKSSYNIGLANFVGHTYEGQGDRVNFDGKHVVNVRTNMALEGSTGRALEVLSEKSGQLVRKLLLNPDDTDIEWDGKDDNGNVVESGKYVVKVVSSDREGKTTNQAIYLDRTIDGLTYKNGMPAFRSGEEEIYKIHKWTNSPQPKLITNI